MVRSSPLTSCLVRPTYSALLVSRLLLTAAKKDPTEGYKTLTEGTPVFIHPSSALFNRQPDWCIYNEIVMTT
jgi:ATP-dependent RNA helicase DHX8/PRP22